MFAVDNNLPWPAGDVLGFAGRHGRLPRMAQTAVSADDNNGASGCVSWPWRYEENRVNNDSNGRSMSKESVYRAFDPRRGGGWPGSSFTTELGHRCGCRPWIGTMGIEFGRGPRWATDYRLGQRRPRRPLRLLFPAGAIAPVGSLRHHLRMGRVQPRRPIVGNINRMLICYLWRDRHRQDEPDPFHYPRHHHQPIAGRNKLVFSTQSRGWTFHLRPFAPSGVAGRFNGPLTPTKR